MDISILEQAPTSNVHNGAEAVRFAVDLAKEGEKLGYKRIWVAEHHNTKNYASPSPELLVAAMSSATERIRLGTGGIMLMHYSPYKIAENVKTLSALAPGRMDFGAGRAPGGDHDSTYALATAKAPDFSDQYEKLSDTLKMVNEQEEESSRDHLQAVYTTPDGIELPEAWLLGSSGNSAEKAGEFGMGYSFAQFFALDSMDEAIFDRYRKAFKAGPYMDKAKVMVAYLVTVAETEEEAEYLALPQDIHLAGQARGKELAMPSSEEASQMELSAELKEQIQINRSRHLVGSVQQVADYLRREVDHYGIDELMICANQAEFETRLNTYRLLAEELI